MYFVAICVALFGNAKDGDVKLAVYLAIPFVTRTSSMYPAT